MPCEQDFDPCEACVDCVEPVTCDDINYSDDGCPETVALRCVQYTGNALPCINVLKLDSGDTILTKLNAKICQMDIPIVITNTDHTISIVQSGYNSTTIVLNTVLSTTSGNILSKNSTGLYAIDQDLVTTDTSTIDFTTSGTRNHLLTASVKISSDAGNFISAHANGIYSTLILTTTGSSGASTLVASTLNVPTYSLAGLGGVPLSRLITINGSAQDLSADRTWTIAITGTANRITISGGTGLTPTVDIASTYIGQTSITTVGTITTGVWQATPIANAYIANSSITVNAGTGLSGGGTVALGGTITLTNTGVLSTIAGTGISVSNATGNVTISCTITQYTDALARAAISLTTSGSSGASTYNTSTGVFNIPVYSAAGLGAVPITRILTINGTAQDLSVDRTWSVGTVTSINGTAGAGISISGGPITTSGSLTIANTGVLSNIAGTGISVSGATGNVTIANIAPDQTVVLSNGAGISVTGSYPNFTIATTITQYTDALARGAISLTTVGTSGAATYSSSTGVLNIPSYAAGTGTVTSINLTASTGISVSGGPITTSGSITVTNTAPDQTVVLTNGTGINVTGTYPNFIVATTITQYTDSLARAAISLTTTGTSGASTYNNTSGVLNVPTYTLAGLGGVPTGRTLTINGTAFDLSADRSWSVGTVTSVGATAGTGISIGGSPVTTSGSITITNTAPDQVVALTAGTNISITGTYPNFTINSTAAGSQSLQDVCNIGNTTTTNITANAFFETSDKRLKTLILDNPLFNVSDIKAKYYLKGGVKELGYYAQDFEDILPSAVRTAKEGNLMLSYREVFVAKITALENKIKELEARLA